MSGDDKNWHVKREVSVGHMISTIMLCTAGLAAWDNLGDRVDRLEAKSDQLELADGRQAQRFESIQNAIDGKLEKIDGKMDRIIDRMLDRNGNGY